MAVEAPAIWPMTHLQYSAYCQKARVTVDEGDISTDQLGSEAVTGPKIAGFPAATNGQFATKTAGSLQFRTIVDADIPATIARDAEVTTTVGTAITDHEAAVDPHPGYLTQTEGDARYHQLSSYTIASGTWTPTLTNVANLDASAVVNTGQYLRVGSVVTCSFSVTVDPTATATTQLGISLPIASNFANANECAGTASASGVVSESAAIVADATNNRAEMVWVTTSTANHTMYGQFTYRII